MSYHNQEELDRNKKAIKVLNTINQIKEGDGVSIEEKFKIIDTPVNNFINTDINLDILKKNINFKQNLLKSFKYKYNG